jgi:hypothetical protein
MLSSTKNYKTFEINFYSCIWLRISSTDLGNLRIFYAAPDPQSLLKVIITEYRYAHESYSSETAVHIFFKDNLWLFPFTAARITF